MEEVEKKEKEEIDNSWIASLFFLFLLVVIGFFILLLFFSVKIEPGQLGIKTVNFDIPGLYEKGVQKNVLGPGFHILFPTFEKIDLFDATVQTYRMSRNVKSDSINATTPLEVRTIDESTVTVDVTVIFQVDRMFAYDYWQNVGKTKQQIMRIENKVRDSLKLALGNLKRDEFYSNSAKRESISFEVVQEINDSLDKTELINGKRVLEKGSEAIKIIDILISDFYFTEEYEQKITDKSLVEEETMVQKAKEKQETISAQIKLIEAEGASQIALIHEQGDAEARQIRADADLYYAKKISEADLAAKASMAEGRQALNEAFSGVGGRNSVGLEYAKSLKNVDTIILNSTGKEGVNPLDVTRMMNLFGVKQ